MNASQLPSFICISITIGAPFAHGKNLAPHPILGQLATCAVFIPHGHRVLLVWALSKTDQSTSQ
eukprot:8856937-Prorocentrum_lima.AAC.1